MILKYEHTHTGVASLKHTKKKKVDDLLLLDGLTSVLCGFTNAQGFTSNNAAKIKIFY